MDRRRDPHDASAADANAAAAARLRKAVLATDKGELVTPPNVGLEVNDVVAYTGSRTSPSRSKKRASAASSRSSGDRARSTSSASDWEDCSG